MQLSFVPGRLKINEDDWNHESEDSTETVISAHGSLNIVKEFTYLRTVGPVTTIKGTDHNEQEAQLPQR